MHAPALLARLCVANRPRCEPTARMLRACHVLGFAVGLAERHLLPRGHTANPWLLLLSPAVASCQHVQTHEVWISVEIPAQDY